jgi:hypothetical protein
VLSNLAWIYFKKALFKEAGRVLLSAPNDQTNRRIVQKVSPNSRRRFGAPSICENFAAALGQEHPEVARSLHEVHLFSLDLTKKAG